MLATYKKLSIFFIFKSAICQLVALCLFTIVPYYNSNFSQFSLIFFRDIVNLIMLSSRRSY